MVLRKGAKPVSPHDGDGDSSGSQDNFVKEPLVHIILRVEFFVLVLREWSADHDDLLGEEITDIHVRVLALRDKAEELFY